MSEDLIKRSDAIKAIEPYLDYIEIIPLCGAKPYVREAIYGIRSKIKFIPTIEPKRGRWIEHRDNNGKTVLWKCSECGCVIFSETETDRLVNHKWCSRCGARMKGADDED